MTDLVKMIRDAGSVKILSMLENIDAKIFGHPQGRHLLEGIACSLSDLSEGAQEELSTAVANSDIRALLEVYGGEAAVLGKQTWPCSIPGITYDFVGAKEYLDGAKAVAVMLIETHLEK